MQYDFNGRVAIVTGGACGIGRAIALTLSQGGANIVIADINMADAEKAANEMPPGAALPVRTDVSSED